MKQMLEDNLSKHNIFLNSDIIYYGGKNQTYLALLKCNCPLTLLTGLATLGGCK